MDPLRGEIWDAHVRGASTHPFVILTVNPMIARLGAVTAVSLAVLVVLGLFVSDPDYQQGDAVRLMYLHVPAAWVAYLAYGVTSLASALYLWKRTRSQAWDTLAGPEGKADAFAQQASTVVTSSTSPFPTGPINGIGVSGRVRSTGPVFRNDP